MAICRPSFHAQREDAANMEEIGTKLYIIIVNFRV